MANEQTPQAQAPEQSAPPEKVDSGLISLAVPAAQPAAEAASAEQPSTDPIQIADASPPPQVAKEFGVSDEKPEDFVDPTPATPPKPQEPLLDPRQMEALQKEAHRENQKKDFYDKVMAARHPPQEPEAPPPPLAPRVVEQTNAELAAGRALVARNEELAASRRPRAADATEGTNKPVFRPADYVPDQKKGQGNVQARTL